MIRRLVAALSLAFLFLSSSCTLFLVGAAGTGGYLIRKGEESGGSGKKGTSESQDKSSPKKSGGEKGGSSSETSVGVAP